MPIDPVQSIRVAAILVERLGVLGKPREMKESELELVIGEAQQVYPAVWSHFDDARTALVAMGRDVAAFDQLRRAEGTQLAFDINVYGMKTATFNTAGYERARIAVKLLMRAMPEVDWAQVARDEAREPAQLPVATVRGAPAPWWRRLALPSLIAAALCTVVIFVVVAGPDDKPASHNAVAPTKRVSARIAELAAMRPSCDSVKAAISERVAKTSGFLDTHYVACKGIVMWRGSGVEPGLAVVVTGSDSRGVEQTVRGVVSADGAQDLVTFGLAPGTKLVAYGDISQDGGDELVFADSTSLTVSSITTAGFVDVEGPMPRSCITTIAVAADFRAGRTGDVMRLVLTVPGDAPPSCVEPGRHYFELTRDALSETR
jgi:hypothetical protein